MGTQCERKLEIVYLNIAGLSTNYVALRHLVETKRPNLVFLAETHIVEAEAFDQYNIPGYRVAFCLSHSRHTGGVAIYAKESIKFNIRSNESVENNWFLGISVERGMTIGNFGVVYHSPSSSDQRFLEILDNWWDSFIDLSKLNVIAGDFNIDWLNEPNSNQLKQLAIFCNLKQTVSQVTRISRHSRTLIDHVFSNFEKVHSSTEADFKISDHETIFVYIENDQNHDDRVNIKCWNRYSKQALSQLVSRSLDCHPITGTLDHKAAVLIDTLKECTNKLVFEKSVDINSANSWYSLDLVRLKRERDKKYKKFHRSNSNDDWNRYTTARNVYSRALKKARCEYIQRKIDQHQNNSKKLWKILKKLMKSKGKPPQSITFNGSEEQSARIIADKFNAYFVDSVRLINQSIELVNEPHEIRQPFSENCRFDCFRPITFAKLKDICFSLERSAGIDNVNAKVIQDCFHVIGHDLLDLVNESLQTGHVPKVWKESLVIPIPKVNGTDKAEEFRPINMLHTLEKLLELVVKGQLMNYLNSSDLLIPEQSGYREGHSCESALNLVLAKWKEKIEAKETIFAVFLDLKRAFETISRPLLLQTLKRFGIVGTAYKWFESYLCDRTQKTRFDNFESDSTANTLGVPQGSVLGPILFIIYINDMKRVLRFCDINLFADDTVLFIAAKNLDEAVAHLNEDLHYLAKWLKFKQLKLNIGKTKYLIISSANSRPNVNIVIDGETIERVNELKYLGVIIDDKLTFKSHIDNVIKKMAKKYGILCRLKNELTVGSKIQLYKSIISPHIDFCPSILFLANSTQMLRLQRLQNRVMRLILKCNRYTSSSFMLDALQWLSVKQRVYFLTMVFLYKIFNDMLPRYLCDRIKRGSSLHRYNTRNAEDARTPHFLLRRSQNSLLYKGINFFNSMPRQIKRAATMVEFKKLCISHIKSVL